MLENLNQEQKKAVETTEGPLLVLSGAGTGKTRVLTTRIAYILSCGLAHPWEVLALTFTNKAANEMKNRIAAFLEQDSFGWNIKDLWCGTFHSVCLRILRSNSEKAGLKKDFLIYGEDEQKTVLKNIFATLGLDAKDYKPADWIERISAIKDKGLLKEERLGKTSELILNAYNSELSRLNAVDFGDIILKVLELFEKYPEVLERYQRQFRYILVDEFQDTNNAQMYFLEALTKNTPNPNICCVGDDDQSIYSWRGAEIKHILGFEKHFENTKVIRLETNYRSTANILGAANSLIRHNNGRLGKELRNASDKNKGEPVYVLTLPTGWDEAKVIADTILRKKDDEQYKDYAVLIRSGSLSRQFEEEFTARGIPYKLVGATKFYDRAEVKDAIAYLRVLVYPFDDLSLLRVIGKPKRNLGASAISDLREYKTDLFTALKKHCFTGKKRAGAENFVKAFDFDWQSMSPAAAAQTLLENAGYLKMWKESKEEGAQDRLDNIKELITNVISKYDTLSDFLEHAALMMTDDNDSEDAANNKDAVNVMTIHAAKGLEFDTVFLPAWEDGIFPNDMAINEGAIEEERRLAYVAITRARKRAVISNAMSRVQFGERKYNSPSRFITEIDNKFLDFQGISQPRYYNTSYSQSYQPKPKVKTSLVGCLVSHEELGKGTVIAQDGDILTIAFGSKGIKKVAKDFITID